MIQDNELIDEIVKAIQDKKGHNIALVDLTQIPSASAQHFVICQANSTQQVAAIADNIRESLRLEKGVKPYNYDGYQNSLWIVIDYGHIYVHVFQREWREYYNLEQLWNDAPITTIADLD